MDILSSPMLLPAFAGFLAGLLVGLAAWMHARLQADRESGRLEVALATLESRMAAERDRSAWLASAETRLRESFGALAGESLRSNARLLSDQAQRDLDAVVRPLKENLGALDRQIRRIEQVRAGAYSGLREEILHLRDAHRELRESTRHLAGALKSPTARGRWGEIQLRRVVEMAGMTEHVAFTEQAHAESGRPDLVCHLPHGGTLPVDSKVPLDAYLRALETDAPAERRRLLAEHARAMRARVKDLGRKEYWRQFPRAPEFVVMFVPNEACLGAAFEIDPDLLEFAFGHHVLIGSPVTLLALLRATAFGWQQQRITENAAHIAAEGRNLHARFDTFIRHFTDVGTTLGNAVSAYNRTLASMHRRLLPAVKRFETLGISTTEITPPPPVDEAPSPPQAPAAAAGPSRATHPDLQDESASAQDPQRARASP